jgi:methyl-accepting chemotaxis protein
MVFHFFASISIRLKVILAFAFVLCCTTGLGGFAIQRLDAVNDAAAVIRDASLPSTRSLGELAYHTMRFRQLESTRALAPDAAAKEQESASMRRVAAQGSQALQGLEPLVGTGSERPLFEQVKQ